MGNTSLAKSTLESYFAPFRKNTIGIDAIFQSPYGPQKLIYADWIASGRLYQPIEDAISQKFGPMVGNTHSESTATGSFMTHSYHLAHQINMLISYWLSSFHFLFHHL